MGNDHPCRIVGIGSVKIQMFDGGVRTLQSVKYIPDMRKNLISLGVLDTNGHQWTVADGILQVKAGDKVILKGKKHKNLYILEGNTVCGEANLSSSRDEKAYMWHSRLGHMGEKNLEILYKKGLLQSMQSTSLDFCEHCVYGKHKRHAFGVGTHSSKEMLEYIHSDVWGPSPIPSHSGKLYYVSFIDDYSRFVWVYFLHNKSDVFVTFKKWRALVENQTGKRVRYLRSDNGGEYDSKEFRLYCNEQGIVCHLTAVYTPQQNGVAERLNRTLLERVRSMLSQSGLPHEFWAEAVNTAAYLVNLSPSKAIDSMTPFEKRYGRPANYRTLIVFGCDAYPLTPKVNRSKLDPTSKKCVFLGYQTGVKGYRLWDPIARKIIVSRDVSFNEPR